MKIICVVQARFDSKRLPGKVTASICGQSALDHLLDRATRTNYRVIVATTNSNEDWHIRRIAEARGITGFTLPEQDMSISVPKRMFAVADTFGAQHIVRITGDDILVEPGYVKEAVFEHLETGSDFTRIPELPKGFDCEVISKKALQRLFSEFDEDEYIGDILGDPNWFKVHNVEAFSSHRRPDINLELNTEDDLQRLRTVFAALYRPWESPFSLDDVLAKEEELGEILHGVAA